MTSAFERTKARAQTRARSLSKLGVAYLVCVAIIAVTAIWIDLPLSNAVFSHNSAELTDRFLTSSPPLLVHAIPDLGLIAILWVLARRSGERWKRFFLLSGAVGIFAYGATELIFKPIFGRSDPHDWIWHHHSAFHFFSQIGGSYSFPSGHAALATGALVMLWLLQKQTSNIALWVIAAFDLAMVVLNIHFLSDVAAGSLVGYATARLFVCRSTSQKIDPEKIAEEPKTGI